MKTAAIVQSSYLPWKGYFDLIHDADIFKVLRPIAELLRKKLKKSEKILESLGKE